MDPDACHAMEKEYTADQARTCSTDPDACHAMEKENTADQARTRSTDHAPGPTTMNHRMCRSSGGGGGSPKILTSPPPPPPAKDKIMNNACDGASVVIWYG